MFKFGSKPNRQIFVDVHRSGQVFVILPKDPTAWEYGVENRIQTWAEKGELSHFVPGRYAVTRRKGRWFTYYLDFRIVG